MAPLTEEQIERAYVLIRPHTRSKRSWKRQSDKVRTDVRELLTASAPHLQFPIEPPTEAELEQAVKDYWINLDEGANDATRHALRQFIARRNAPPEPSLRERVRQAIKDKQVERAKAIGLVDYPVPDDVLDSFTDSILAVLPKEKR
jgi:hypothetical protein